VSLEALALANRDVSRREVLFRRLRVGSSTGMYGDLAPLRLLASSLRNERRAIAHSSSGVAVIGREG
jgi:hypothetical protein